MEQQNHHCQCGSWTGEPTSVLVLQIMIRIFSIFTSEQIGSRRELTLQTRPQHGINKNPYQDCVAPSAFAWT